jgi:hypothetical protein
MLRRLLGMGIGEVADRSRQEASKWLERKGLRRLPLLGSYDLLNELVDPQREGCMARALGETAAGAQGLFGHFQAMGSGRFFPGAVDAFTPALFARLAPEARDRTVAAAESVKQGCFDLLGYQRLLFGDPVDWRLDPISGRRSPLIHWSLINPTDAASVGDAKVVWELSRQQFLVTLGVAYRTTGDEHYGRVFTDLIQGWMRANPPGLGVNWASSLEVAVRIVSWSWALFLFGDSRHVTPDLFASIFSGIGAHAAHVERYLSSHCSPNTHLTGEALGLFYAGVLFPEHKAAARWKAIGQRILEEQIQRQVLADGVHFEQATAYQRYTIEIYLHYLILAARNNIAASIAAKQRVHRMLDVLLALRRPNGGMPRIGDDDGGSLLPLVPRAPDDMRGVFAIAAVCLKRADCAWAAEGLQPEALWLLGPSAVSTFEGLGAAPPREVSRVFGNGGYVVMRSGWQRTAHHLIFDVGPLGCPITGAHGHADLLSIQVSPFGDPYIVDPGTYAYSADPAFRAHFRETGAHATVVVDGQSQANSAGPFAWRQRPEARLHCFRSTPEFDLADASHDAYRRLPDPVVHRRRVVFVKSPGYWVVLDDLTGDMEHRVELRFQFAPMSVVATETGWVRALGAEGRGLLLRAFADRPLGIQIEEGSTSPIEGWVSPTYGRRDPAPIVIYRASGRLPLRILTLLLPVHDSGVAPPALEPLLDLQGAPLGLSFTDLNETIRFGVDSFTSAPSSTCKA